VAARQDDEGNGYQRESGEHSRQPARRVPRDQRADGGSGYDQEPRARHQREWQGLYPDALEEERLGSVQNGCARCAQDAAPGDLELFADLAVLLGKSGRRAEILLPRQLANSAGLEVMGADPAFTAGREAAADLPGAATSQQLRDILEAGDIRAALVIGENPLDFDRTGSWFANVEFFAAMDWSETETTRFADVTLPGATFLETPGTRCNFEGVVTEFSDAVAPPSGLTGTEVLGALGRAFGLEVPDDLTAHIGSVVESKLGGLLPFYWNTGQARTRTGHGALIPVEMDTKTAAIQPPLTHSQKYRKEIREVGTERFRVQQ